ncbi:nitroreductase family protein [Tenacibaculum piscium]|uniref:Nitroreductase n=1 Tax=Tenacibaculum piscium TaxID=1458515 RepID=A0A2H1YJ00_9FLAO|nr:nitroreductase family protein [Tenacibaculum piscium]MBE7628693.1 nitroreductase family protein [Tenacibaculum piscium]MBE7684571.1 nitroreductase family protein [Tenacibaculum piscium]SOS75482.1 Nitroreductase [Tenacibaculum piscium]
MIEKTVPQAINFRRSVRVFDAEKSIESSIVKKCIEQATLAPNSSNMQLWEFYHITSKDIIAKMAPLCFNQNAAKTAQQLVVFVTRKDVWKKRVKANLAVLDATFGKDTPKEKQTSREKMARTYYGKIIPFTYFDFLGIFGWLKYLIILITGLFRPIYREVRNSDMRIVAHKSTGLAAQNFMLSMAAEGYDTCPMEGADTWRVKRLLNIPRSAEINMIVSCGIRTEKGVYGERFRIPFNEVYKEI